MKPLLEIVGGGLSEFIRKAGQTKIFNDGEQVFAEGERAVFLPIVLTGKVKLFRSLEAGKEVIIDIFGTGEMFAVPPAFDGKPYPTTAVAVKKTKLLLLPREVFLRLLAESSEFSVAVIAWMCAMLREKTEAITNLATASPEQRAANVLVRTIQRVEPQNAPIIISLRRQDIAEMAGMTTETTIRAVRQLADKNVIRIERGKIIVDDVESLREYLLR